MINLLTVSTVLLRVSAPPRSFALTRYNLCCAVLLAIGVVRLAGLAWELSRTHYQVDFSAYWAAGRLWMAGADPYTGLLRVGGVPFFHSAYLYPPLAAVFFAPFALLPYAAAKLLWTLGQITCLMGSAWLTG